MQTGSKDKALKLYEEDLMRAVQDGFVKVQGEKVISWIIVGILIMLRRWRIGCMGSLFTRMQREVFLLSIRMERMY